jgi:hypothetical protein
MKFWEELIAYFPWYDTDLTENDMSNNSSIVACAFVTAAKLPSNDGGIFIEPLPSNDKGIFTEPSRYLARIKRYTHRHTDWWEGFFN